MRIERLDLKAFGRFTNQSLDLARGGNQFHIVYGPNESGKSTTLRAIAAWLFGMPVRSTDAYLHSYANMRVGGRLVASTGDALECIRRKGKAKTLLSLDEKTTVDEQDLMRLLGGMDEETFLRGFGLDRERLIAGGRGIIEGEGDLGEILFSAGVGVNRLSELKRKLDDDLRAIYLPQGQRPLLNQAITEARSLREELKEVMLPPAQYSQCQRELAEAEQRAEEIKQRAAEARRRLDLCRRQQEALPLAHQRQSVVTRVRPLLSVPRLDAAFATRRRDAESNLRVARQSLEVVHQQLQRVDEQLAALPENQGLTRFAPRIEALVRQAGVQEDAQARLQKLEREAEQHQRQVTDLLRRLGRSPDTDVDSLRVSDALRDRIWSLAEEGTRLRQQLALDSDRLREFRLDLATAGRRLEECARPEDSTALDAALRRMDQPDRLRKEIRAQEETVARCQDRTRAALARLSGFSGDADQALHLAVPAPATVERCASTYNAVADQLAEADAALQDAVASRDHHQAALERLCRSATIPTEAELLQARQHRDALLAKIDADVPPGDLAERVRDAVAQADRIADALRNDATLVAKRAQIEGQLVELEHQIRQLTERRRTCTERHAEAVQQWHALWQTIQVEPSTPQEMQHWLQRHTAVCDAALEQIQAERQLQSLREDQSRVRDQLLEVLTPLAPRENLEVLDAEGLRDLAVEKQETLRKMRQEHQAAATEVERLRRETEKLADGVQQVELALERWQTQWNDAVEVISHEGDASPEEVRKRLETSDSLLRCHSQLRGTREQIERIHEERSAFDANVASTVAQVAQWVDALEDPDDSIAAVGRMEHALREAQRDDQRRQTLSQQRDEQAHRIRQHEETILCCEAELRTLCDEVGCASPEELPEIERRSAERDALESELRQIEHQLRRLAGGKPLEEFVEEVERLRPADLEDEIVEVEDACQQLEKDQDEWNRSVGALRGRRDSMDGRGAAADKNQEIHTVLARAGRLAHQYAVLAIQSAALGEAIEHYRQQNQGPILQCAERIFAALTCGDYRGLRPHYDEKGKPILVGLRGEAEEMVPANAFSEGTADALFLSLRLASLLAHVDRRGPVPLILDDVLVQFDDGRCAAALRVLCDIGRQTQVIFFTHHKHLLDLAGKELTADEYQLHEITVSALP